MKTILKITLILLFPLMGFSQTEINPLLSTPYIEVTGNGEMEIIPDEIFLQFTLKERYDGKVKIDIDDLEKKLRQRLRSKGIQLDKLSLANATAEFVKIKRKNKDVLATKNYIVEVSNTGELSKVWSVLEEVDATNAYIKKVDHSKIQEFKKKVKIKAIKQAKEKANYLLEAIDQGVGKALFIQERESYNQPIMYRQKTSLMMMDSAEAGMATKEPEMSFQKIKLQYKVFARFAIN